MIGQNLLPFTSDDTLHLISIILAAVLPPIIGSDSENQVPSATKSKTFKTLFDEDLFQ